MLDEDRFIDEMWQKYRRYSKDKNEKKEFFNKNVFRNSIFLLSAKNLALCIMTILISGLLVTGTYAAIKSTLEPKAQYVQEEGYIENPEDFGYMYEDYMNYSKDSGIYYKKINTYEEYKTLKEKYSNIIEVEKEEFDKYFLILFLGDDNDTIKDGICINKIDISEDTIYIEIKVDYKKNNQLIFAKVEKEKDRENIEIELVGEKPQMSKYIAMEDLPEDYSKEQAIKDNCVVIEGANGKYVSRPEALKEFIKRTESGINDNIRVVEFFTKEGFGSCITDIEYRDGKYFACADQRRYYSGFEHDDYRYIVTDKIEFIERTDGKNIKEAYIMTDTKDGRTGAQIFINIWF